MENESKKDLSIPFCFHFFQSPDNFVAKSQSSVYQAGGGNHSFQAEFFIGQTKNILVEKVFQSFVFHPERYEKTIATPEGRFVSQVDPGYNGIDPLVMELVKIETNGTQELMPGMFQVILIHRIIDNSLQIAFVIPDGKFKFVIVILCHVVVGLEA